MADIKKGSLFAQLTRLFRSGPSVRRKVKNFDPKSASSTLEIFKKAHSNVYNSTLTAYGAFDRMSRYSDFCEMEACVSGDTHIAVPDGFVTIKELSEKYKDNETFIVYSYDHTKKQVVPALGKNARKTTTDLSYIVKFDSGKSLIASKDHRCMKRDGTYCEVQDLKAGDSMMPFYRRNLFDKDDAKGYQWIYTMNHADSTIKNGWVTEHKVIAEWVADRKLNHDEVVHHINFIKYDNRPENLQIMTEAAHKRYHAEILNGKKWDKEINSEWIEKFKKNHSNFMTLHNPAERHDITFAKILQVADGCDFHLDKISKILDCSYNAIANRLSSNGFDNFTTFAKAYKKDWKNAGHDNRGKNNPRYDDSIDFQKICSVFEKNDTLDIVSKKLNTTAAKVVKRIKNEGFKNWKSFNESFANHKVISVEEHDVIDLYDLTVDGYKNFATDSIIIHNTPEICSALDIISEEVSPCDDRGKVLHIQSDNTKIQEILEELFYDVLNVDFNLVMWTRNLVKYGDFFLFNDISPEYGIINVYPIPISEIEREEGFDKDDPSAVRFRWISQGNKSLENWQVSHFRLLGNDAFLPYGSSVLESARRIWRQLILMEDAMLVYRVIRAPERRVFYIDVGNVPPDQVANYMEQSQTSLKRQPVIDRNTGKMDLRFNPYTQEEDYFLPVRGGESGTKIDTLAGGVNAAAIEDVEYIQKKLFAALKIPKAYLGYDEDIGSKATLAQEDIRFSRTVQHIQKTVISELEKIAMIHLYCHGFDPEDISDFTIRLTNPSSVAQLQKLELIKTKFEIAASTPEGIVDRNYIRKNVIGLTDDEIEQIKKGRIDDKIEDAMVEKADDELEQNTGVTDPAVTDMGDESDATGSPEASIGDTGSEENIFAGDRPKGELLTAKPSEKENDDNDEYDDEYDEPLDLSMDDDDAPEKAEKKLNIWGGPIKANRKITNGRAATHMPDFFKMTSIGSSARNQDSMNKPYGDLGESATGGYERKRVSNSLEKLFKNMSNSISINRGKNLLSEQKLDETYEDDNDEA